MKFKFAGEHNAKQSTESIRVDSLYCRRDNWSILSHNDLYCRGAQQKKRQVYIRVSMCRWDTDTHCISDFTMQMAFYLMYLGLRNLVAAIFPHKANDCA